MQKSEAAKGVLWSLAESGGLALVSFSALILYARYLSVDEFGLFSIVLAAVELLGVLVGMLFHDVLVQREHVSEEDYNTAFTFGLGLSVALLLGCVLISPVFQRLVDVPGAGAVLAWTALCFPSSALSATLVARQRRELAFRPLAMRSLVGRLGGAAVGIGLVLSGGGIWGLVAQQVLIALVGSAVLWFAADNRPILQLRRDALKDLLVFGAYAVSGLFLTFAVKRIFVVVAGVMLGAEHAGYLNLGFRAVDVLWAISASAVGQVALPVLSRLQTDRERLRRVYKTALEFVCLVLYPAFVGLALTAPEVIDLVFGAQWLPSTPSVIALALLVLAQAPRLLSKPVLTAVGRPRDSLYGLVVELTVVIALLATLGAHSLPWAIGIWTVRELVAVPVMVGVVRRATGLTFTDQFRGALVPLLACAIMAGVVCVVRVSLPESVRALRMLIVLVAVGTLTFTGSAWLLDRRSAMRVIEFMASSRETKLPSL